MTSLHDAVRLQLFVGPAVAVAAPADVVDALQEVKVQSASGSTRSGFELTFELSNRSPLQYRCGSVVHFFHPSTVDSRLPFR